MWSNYHMQGKFHSFFIKVISNINEYASYQYQFSELLLPSFVLLPMKHLQCFALQILIPSWFHWTNEQNVVWTLFSTNSTKHVHRICIPLDKDSYLIRRFISVASGLGHFFNLLSNNVWWFPKHFRCSYKRHHPRLGHDQPEP